MYAPRSLVLAALLSPVLAAVAATPVHAKATIAAGPNNPVGRMWIDLSKPHYGIHGTPMPRTIGKTQSHGCVRLSNWDVLAVATAVDTSVPVVMQE